MVPQEVQEVHKWTGNVVKNTKSHFFSIYEGIEALKLWVSGPTRGPRGLKMDRKWGQKHKISLFAIYEYSEALSNV